MLHIYNKTKEVLKLLKEQGFNGVEMEVNDEHQEREPDEQTVEEKELFDSNYSIFVARPITNYGMEQNQYERFNEDDFQDDFQSWLKKQFGDDVEITYREHPAEYEIIRKGT